MTTAHDLLHDRQWRRRTGADQWDEMWDGVLHMPPMPNREHQELAFLLGIWLREDWGVPGGNRVFPPINIAPVGGWPHNYRIPDLVLLSPDRFHIDRNEYFEGPPLVVIEIRSPGDEALEKLFFYANLGVPEVWVIDRDSKVPEVYELSAEAYRLRVPGDDDWIESPATEILLRAEPEGRLGLQMRNDPATRQILPE